MIRRRKRSSGFTLLEVLMAMTILAIAGITILRTTSDGIANSQYLKNKTMARWVADNELTDIYLSRQWPSLSWKKVTREMADQEWHLRYRSVKTGNDDFRSIQVEVRLDRDEKKAPLSTLETYMVKRT